jgi:PAS domain-containing protein
MLGYKEAELVGLGIGDVFEEAEDEQADAFMGIWLDMMIRTGVVRDVEARFIAKSGTLVPILFSRTAMISKAEVVTDIICIAKDMSGYVKIGDDDLSGSDLPASDTGDSV